MYCKKCGCKFEIGQKFCTNCGTKRDELQDNQTTNVQQAISEQTLNELETKKKFNPIFIIVIIIVVIMILSFIFLVSFLFSNISNNSDKLVCESPEGNITIMYNEQEIIGYTASGMSYNLDEQKAYALQIGINAYLEEFTTWFEKNTTGTCKIKEASVEKNTNDDKINQNINKKNIGDKTFGYLTVPDDWVEFHDINGSTALQYSKAGLYIVTLDYIKDKKHTPKEYASNYMYNMKQSEEVTGVTGATIKLGKNKEYTAYQVYMLYKNEGTYLVTYWFETEDGVVRYIALEGPAELNGVKLTDYLYIAESFSLKG